MRYADINSQLAANLIRSCRVCLYDSTSALKLAFIKQAQAWIAAHVCGIVTYSLSAAQQSQHAKQHGVHVAL